MLSPTLKATELAQTDLRSTGGDGLLFFWKFPKTTLVIIAVVVVLVLVLAGSTPSGPKGGQRTNPAVAGNDRPGTGATLDPKVYDTTLVHEPIAEDGLPVRASLLAWAPPRKSQGKQGSCVGWATSYAARSILLSSRGGLALKAAGQATQYFEFGDLSSLGVTARAAYRFQPSPGFTSP